jgi:outer membrane autotransporter protein
VGARRTSIGVFFASTSALALLAAMAQPAAAACLIEVTGVTGGVTNPGVIDCINVNAADVTGDINNSGTITPGGITITGSTITGAVLSNGTIAGGISIDDQSQIGGTAGIVIGGPTFGGGIVNAGTITTGGAPIRVDGVSTFSEGIVNSGTIQGSSSLPLGTTAIVVSNVSAFSGGITNSGTITMPSGAGILVGDPFCGCGVSTFSGGIVNSNTMTVLGPGIAVVNVESFSGGPLGGIVNTTGSTITSTSATGIRVDRVSSFSGDIINQGTITASRTGIVVLEISTFSGGITNSGTITASSAGIMVGCGCGISLFSGNIVNSGTITSAQTGIGVTAVDTFSGSIVNDGGTITASTGAGILVAGVSTFTGGITNTGIITSAQAGIGVAAVDTFAGAIVNSNTIDVTGGVGILVDGVPTFIGGISNTGAISGMAGIVMSGTSGVSVFNSGAITASAGPAILFDGSGNTLTLGPGSSITGDVLGTGSDTFRLGGTGSDVFDVSSIGAQYQGFATFNKIDASTWRLAGAGAQNWTISGGTLIGDSDSLQGTAITNNATLVFDQTVAGAYGGVISGSGTVVKDGSGTLTFTGANLYSGGTVINAGILQLGGANRLATGGALTVNAFGTFDLNGFDQAVGDFSGSGLVTLGSATLTAGTASSTTFAGVISGSGGLIKQGSGTLFLTGASTYDGPTNVNAGILTVNGSLTSNVFVGAGAMLMGSGSIGGLNLLSGGTLAPGNSIGTINATGNLSLGAGSVYQVEINAAGQSDLVTTSGSATLTGGIVEVIALPGSYGGKTTYTILSAQQGVTGTFAGATSNLAFFTPTLSYDADDVFLTWSRSGYFSSVAQTANQRSVATALDQGPLSNPLVQAVLFQTTGGALAAFDALSGEIHGSVQSVLLEDSLVMRQAILGRLRQSAAAGAGATALAYDGPALAYAQNLPEVIKGPAAPRAASTDLTFWTQGIGAFGRFESDGNAAEATRKLGGFVSGVDARFGEFARVGMAAGYTRATVNVDARASSAGVDTVHLGAYASASFGELSLRGGAAYAIHRIDTSRTVSFPGFVDHTTARYDAGTAQVFGEIGHRLVFGRLVAEPYAGLAYVHLRTDSFAETGGAAALFGTGNNQDIGYSTLGIRAATALPLDHGMILMPRASLAWQHAFGDVTPAAALALQATGAGFSVAGVPAARDAALIEAGLTLDLNAQARLGLGYAAELGRGLQDHGVKGYVSWKF